MLLINFKKNVLIKDKKNNITFYQKIYQKLEFDDVSSYKPIQALQLKL